MKKFILLPMVFLLAFASQPQAAEIDGFTEPSRDLDLAAADTGRIESVDAEEGQRVRAGEILATINQDILKVSRRIVDTQLRAQGKLKSAKADLRLKSERVRKLQELLARRHAGQEEVDRAEIEREISAANVEVVEEERAVRAIERERIDLQIERQEVRSPIDGIVVRTFKDVGEFVSPADPVVVRVVQLNPLVAVFNVPERAITDQFAIGGPALVRVAGAAEPTSATVEYVSPVIEPQSGTVRVKVRIANADESLRAGEKCTLLVADVVDRVASQQ